MQLQSPYLCISTQIQLSLLNLLFMPHFSQLKILAIKREIPTTQPDRLEEYNSPLLVVMNDNGEVVVASGRGVVCLLHWEREASIYNYHRTVCG